jgi:hypothetical protein
MFTRYYSLFLLLLCAAPLIAQDNPTAFSDSTEKADNDRSYSLDDDDFFDTDMCDDCVDDAECEADSLDDGLATIEEDSWVHCMRQQLTCLALGALLKAITLKDYLSSCSYNAYSTVCAGAQKAYDALL